MQAQLVSSRAAASSSVMRPGSMSTDGTTGAGTVAGDVDGDGGSCGSWIEFCKLYHAILDPCIQEIMSLRAVT